MAQESLQDIRKQQKAVERETVREKELHQKEKSSHAAFVESSNKKVQALDQQGEMLRGQMDSLRAELAALEEARAKAQGLSKWVDSRRSKYQDGLAKTLDSLVPVLEADLPFQNQEAAAAMAETAAQLRKSLVTPEEALGRSFDILIDRIQMGYNTESWSGFLSVNSRSIPGKFVRYGAVSALFISQDGEEIFTLNKTTSGYAWNSIGANLDLRQTYKEVLKVAEGKSPPSLVLLPFNGRVGGQP